MTIWNLKRLMSFRDNDLKDACLPILAPVIDQIWSVVLANPGRHVIGICTVAGVTGDRGVNTAELPLGFHSSAHLLFFCSPISPLWSAHQFLCSMTSTVLDHMSYSLITWSQLLLTLEYTFLPGSEYWKNLKGEGYLGDLRLWWSNRFPGSLRSAASSLGPFSNRTVPHTAIWTMNFKHGDNVCFYRENYRR